jgi:hypothetical protein
MNQPMPKQILPHLVAASILLGCDQPQPATGTSKTPATTEEDSPRSLSKEVLPGSKARFANPVGEGQMPRTLAHDTPSMKEEARGQYSYLGAANKFKRICGFKMPEWVEPTEGEYYITKHGERFVSQASLKYKTDPVHIDALKAMVSKAYSKRWPEKVPLAINLSQPDPTGPAYWQTSYHILGKNYDSSSVTIGGDSEGSISVFNTIGPEDWDR